MIAHERLLRQGLRRRERWHDLAGPRKVQADLFVKRKGDLVLDLCARSQRRAPDDLARSTELAVRLEPQDQHRAQSIVRVGSLQGPVRRARPGSQQRPARRHIDQGRLFARKAHQRDPRHFLRRESGLAPALQLFDQRCAVPIDLPLLCSGAGQVVDDVLLERFRVTARCDDDSGRRLTAPAPLPASLDRGHDLLA